MQFVSAQTAENEIIENTLETVDKITTEFLSGNESVSNASKSGPTSTENTSIPISGQSDFILYEEKRMHLKLEYPSTWNIDGESEKSDCNKELCSIFLYPKTTSESFPHLQIISIPPSENEGITTLLNYTKDQYFRSSYGVDFKYINDNQTTIDNHTAIQMEYLEYGKTPTFLVTTKHNDLFYYITYSMLSDDDLNTKKNLFNSYLADAKKIINSIKFDGVYQSENIPKEIIPFITNTTASKERDTPSFINAADIKNYQDYQALREVNSLIGKEEPENIFTNNTSSSSSLLSSVSTLADRLLGKEEPENASSSSIQIKSHNSYVDSADAFHIVGEVQNNKSTPVNFVEIIGTFYDSNGNVVGTTTTYTKPSTINPKETAPFDLILMSASIPIHEIDSYKLTVTSQ